MGMQDEGDKVIVCERGDLVFVFNFHPTKSYSEYGVGCKNAGNYKVCCSYSHGRSVICGPNFYAFVHIHPCLL